MRTRSLATATVVSLILLARGPATSAAEIKIIGLAGMTPLMNELAPQFERTTGHKLVMRFGSGAEGKQLIETDETFDLAVLNPLLIARRWPNRARLPVSDAHRNIPKRNGRGRPRGRIRAGHYDGRSVQANLLNAELIAYSPGRASGIHVEVLDRLGIAELMKAKTKAQPRPEDVAKAVAEGKAELGFAAMNLLIGVRERSVRAFLSTPGLHRFHGRRRCGRQRASAAKVLVDLGVGCPRP